MATTDIYTYRPTLSLHYALPISSASRRADGPHPNPSPEGEVLSETFSRHGLSHAPITLFHRPAYFRRRARRHHHHRRCGRLYRVARVAISRHRPADGNGDRQLSWRLRRNRRRYGRGADRAGNQRRRQYALYEQPVDRRRRGRSEEHTSELQSLMRI